MSEREPTGFARYRARAERLAEDLTRVDQVARDAQQKLASDSGVSAKFREVRSDLADFLDLLKAYANGSYRQVPKAALVSILGAALYFVMPLDVIPDFLLGVGLLDDAAVIGFVLAQFRVEIERFRAHREAQSEVERAPEDSHRKEM